jgi:predicted AlkP superfamily pyrophosphatase or phosphodiesterase
MRSRSARVLSLLACALLVPALVFAAGKPEPKLPAPRRVLMVSIDGLSPSAYLDPDAHGLKIPNLRRLMAAGAYAEGVTGVLPTMTYPSHTTLITGAPPRVHGILTNTVFDPLGNANQAWHWFYEEIRVPTLIDAAKHAGLTVGAVAWPVTVGAPADALFPEIWRAGSTNPYDLHLQAALSTPGLVAAVEQELGRPLSWPLTDEDRTDVALHVLRTLRPNLMLVHLIEHDHWQHEDGPGSAAANDALERDDVQLGRMLDALKELELDASTLVVVVSDHGFLPTTTSLRPNVRLAEAGLITLEEEAGAGSAHDAPTPCHPKVASWRAMFQTQGGTALLRLADPGDAEALAKVRSMFVPDLADPDSGIDQILEAKEIEAEGGDPSATPLVLDARSGYRFDADLTGDRTAPATSMGSKGTHGYAPTHPELAAALILAGPDLDEHGDLGTVAMTSIAPQVARWLRVDLAP